MSDRSYQGYVSIRQVSGQGMITLRADLKARKVATAVKSVTGVAMPALGECNTSGHHGVAWMSPDEALILVPHSDIDACVSKLTKDLGKIHALVADVSDARAMFTLEGDAVREVLAKLAPADLTADTFKIGMMRRTRIAQAAGAIWMPSPDTANVICFRSVQDYMFALLSNAAKEGSQVFL